MSSVNKDFLKRAGAIVALVSAAILLVLLFTSTVKVFLLVFAGLMISVFFRSIAHGLGQLTSWSTKVTLPISVVGVLGLWVLLVMLLAPRVNNEVERMRTKIPAATRQLQDNLEETSLGRVILKQIPFDLDSPYSDSSSQTSEKTSAKQDSVSTSGEEASRKHGQQTHMQDIRSRVMGFFSSTLGILGDLYVILFFGIFFMVNPLPYKKGIIKLVPKKKRKRAEVIYDATGITLRSWLLGKMLSMLVVAILSVIGLWILGIPLFITLALFAGIMSFIPNFGPLIAIVPAFLVAYLQGPQQALAVVLLYMGVQFVESNIITPFIMKRQIEVPLAMTLFSQLLLGYLVGGWGLVFATPIMAAFMVLVEMIYIEDILGDNDLDIKGERLAHKKHKEE